MLKSIADAISHLKYNLGRNFDFRLSTILYLVFCTFTFLACILFFIYSNNYQGNKIYPVIAAVLIFTFFTIVFKKIIYNPIINAERAIKNIIGNSNFEFDNNKGSRIYPFSDDLIRRLKGLIDREYTEKILRKQAELNALQSQINPHFLYNTLDCIRSQAVCEGVNTIADMTKALSNLFRYSISQKDNLVSLAEELRNMDHYLVIQQYRFNNKFNIVKIIDEDVLEYKIPKLTIQPIVENAIFHGLEVKDGKGKITIRAYATEKRVVINVADDGIGIQMEKLHMINKNLTSEANVQYSQENENHASIALKNVNERIKLYFGEEFGIKVYSTLGVGTDIEIIVPTIKD